MKKTVKEIAQAVNGKIIGDENIIVTGVCSIKEACHGDITFLAHPKYKSFLQRTQASVVITSKDITETASKTIIQTENPSLAFTKIISIFMPQDTNPLVGVDKRAVVEKGVKLSKDVYVGPCAVIEKEVHIGPGVKIYPNCFIGKNVKIGKNSLIHPNVTIREGSIIGEDVIIHSGSVIGSDGFGYVEVNGEHHKVPQVGIVIIEDNVEIGANVTIDRARFGQTIIGKGSKIDNLVQIAHNVNIGPNSIVVAQAGISGSASIGKNTILAGQVGLAGHIELGDNVIVGAQAGVTKSYPADSILLGSPAKPISEQKKIFAYMSRLPELFNTLKEIKNKLLKEDNETKHNKK